MTGVVRWEDPPPVGPIGRRPTRAWCEVAEELRGRPGCWAVIAEGDGYKAQASRVALGRQGFDPPGAYEAVTRGGGRALRVYARYVGDPS